MKLPVIKAKGLIRILEKLEFKFIRQKGSHMFFAHVDGRTTIVPNHPGEDLDRGLLNKIIKHDIKISKKEFIKLLK